MTGRHYTDQEKAKVRAMIKYGLSKIKAAQILHIAPATIWRWNIPATFKNKTYPSEVRQEAIRLYKAGISRLKISIKLGVGMRALNHWLGKGKDGREFKIYPIAVRLKARRLAREGMPKFEIPNILHVSHPTIIRWTSDIKSEKSRISGSYFQILCTLINEGSIIIKRTELWRFKILSRQAKIRAFALGNKAVIFIRGRERFAENSFIKALGIKDADKRQLNTIRRAIIKKWD